MNLFALNPRTKAFTLVELLVVIAIIGILAALLLPVLNGGQRRAQRIFCENELREMGIAFHIFSNDHTGRFPTDVSTNDGGSMEFIQNGFHEGKIFYTAFRNFQVLSNELVKPQILICPSDIVRGAASNFPALQNQNLSYFVGANGMFDKPTSILAGDRNLVTNAYETPTIVQIGPGSRLSWTWEIHQLQGNILLADGHVEEWSQSGLKNGENQFSPNENLFLPSVAAAAGMGSPGTASMQPMAPMSSSPPSQIRPASTDAHESMSTMASTAADSESSSEAATTTTTTTSNTAVAVPGDSLATMSSFDQHLTLTLQHTFEWIYLVLLLLALLYFIYRVRKWMRQREAKQKASQLPQDPWED